MGSSRGLGKTLFFWYNSRKQRDSVDKLLQNFFKDFFKDNRLKIVWFSIVRMFAFCQVLFWPFAFSKIIDILSQGIDNWQAALPWAAALVINKVAEDLIRLRSKYGLQKIGAGLELRLATFFTQKTELCEGIKTGEAMQRTKRASDTINSAAEYYKDNLLQLPVNFIVIPIVLLTSRTDYFIIFTVYVVVYLLIDYFANTFYLDEAEDYFQASEVFWGTAYRKTPDVWRERVDGFQFREQIEQQADNLYKERMEMENVDNWRWVTVQVLSSVSQGLIILYAFYLIIKGQAPVGDLVLLSGYFSQAQSSLNIVTTTAQRIGDLRISLSRLAEAVKLKDRQPPIDQLNTP